MPAIITAEAEGSRKRYITDLYDEERGTFRVQYPVWLVVALSLSGLAAFALVGFFGYRDTYAISTSAFTAGLFREPWPLFLWFCALIITLEVSILRHPSLRRQLVATLIVTLASIIIVGVSYFYNVQLQQFLQNLLQALLNIRILIPEIGQIPGLYAILNFGVILIFWVDTIRRWVRYQRGQSFENDSDFGIMLYGRDEDKPPTFQELVSGDLIAGALLTAILAVVFRADVLNIFSKILNINVFINTCTVSWPIGQRLDPQTGLCLGGGGPHDPPTLFFMDILQALLYLSIGLLVLAISATVSGLDALQGQNDNQLPDQAPNANPAIRPESNTQSAGEQVAVTVLNTLRAALNRRLAIAIGNLGLALRNAVWPALILVSVIASASVARYIQNYLHLQSDDHDRTHLTANEIGLIVNRLNGGEQYISLALAVLWGALAVLAIVVAMALLLFHLRVAENSLRFLGLIGFILLLTTWIFSLALSGFNALINLINNDYHRLPFPWFGATTIISLASLLIFGVFLLFRRVRRPQTPVAQGVNAAASTSTRQ